jgi:hypothetical protein
LRLALKFVVSKIFGFEPFSMQKSLVLNFVAAKQKTHRPVFSGGGLKTVEAE